MIPTLTNIYLPDEMYVWMRLVPDGLDLQPEAAHEEEVGERFEWMDQEDLIESTMGAAWKQSDEFTCQWMYWALEHGLAPWQVFLVQVGKPHWYKCSYEYEEYDCDFSGGFERALPMREMEVIRQWRTFLEERESSKRSIRSHRRRLKELRETDVAKMFIKTDVYWSRRAYSDGPPDGIRVILFSKAKLDEDSYGSIAYLASGDDDDGERAKAFEKMVENAKKLLPHIPEEVIRSRPLSY